MENNNDLPSLLPYLKLTKDSAGLRISLLPEDSPAIEGSRTPFLMIGESSPVARLIEARFVTDAGSVIKRVFMLLQKDEYLLAEDELWPVSNRDVDRWWQKTFLFYSGKDYRDDFPIMLADQLKKGDGISPLQPLFYCQHRKIYFHPHCCKCGMPLQECANDELLSGLELKPYSTSLRRYLFCPSCQASQGKTDFYVFSRESSDPAFLKDRWNLIREFGLLNSGKNRGGQSPCPECNRHQECYGPEDLVVSRIIPLSFYPFYMLMFEAMSVNSLDFLSLISGASFAELEGQLSEKGQPGRVKLLNALKQGYGSRVPFFFDGEERYFLEILYLKLSFLGELIQTIFSGPNMDKFLKMGLNLDRIWVKFTDQGGFLPFFWNFKVKLIDVLGDTGKTPSLPKLPPSYGLYFLGLVWFYSLLVNKKQGVAEIYAALGKMVDEVSPEGDAFKDTMDGGMNQAFLSKNIFWNPEGRTVNKDWELFWKSSLELGWSLLRAGLNQDPQWGKVEFWEKVVDLRKKIKDSLFSQRVSYVQPNLLAENRAICDILCKIKSRWQEETAGDDDEFEKTVINIESKEEDLDKTVVLPAEKISDLEETASPLAEERATGLSPQAEDVPETVILSSQDFGKEISPSDRPQAEDIPETVIISPADKSKIFSELPHKPGEKNVDQEKKGSTLEEKSNELELKKKGADDSGEDDFLTETVILNLDDIRDNK